MELVSTKIVVLTLLGVLRLVFGLLPLKITKRLQLWGEGGVSHKLVERRQRQVELAISMCLCFGGGVLLATCFLHMLPEVRESLEAVKHSGLDIIPPDTKFPLAELFICCGFFLVFIIEEVAHRLFLHHDHNHRVEGPANHQSCSTVGKELPKFEESSGEKFTYNHDDSDSSRNRKMSNHSAKIVPATSQAHLLSSSLSLDTEALKDGPPAPCFVSPDTKHCCSSGHSRIDSPHRHHHHHHVAISGSSNQVGNLRGLLVVIALSFHSIFEGLAIGLQQTQRDVWYLFTAVAIHACAILFCIGLELVTSGIRVLNLVLYVVVLALVSPLGVVVGIVVTATAVTDSVLQVLVIAVLQGIAGGTILYITFFEVLDREKRKESGCGLVRVLFIILGFLVMVGLQAIGGHDHGGDHSLSSNSSHPADHDHGH